MLCFSNICLFHVCFRRKTKWRRSPTWRRPDHPNSQESPIITSRLTLWFWLLTNGNCLCLTPAQVTPAFSWTRSFEFFSFLPFLEKEKKNIWCFSETNDLHSICSEGRVCVQNAVTSMERRWWLLSGIFALTFSSFGNKQRMVFDIILLGVQNPADTVSAPQSNSFIMLWFIFLGICSLMSFKAPNLSVEAVEFVSELRHRNKINFQFNSTASCSSVC